MIIQRYILRELARTFLFAFAVLVFVAFIGMMLQSIEYYAGLGLTVAVKSLPMALTYMAPWALAVAACIAPTVVYGRLAEENEIDAIVSSGIHPHRVVTPALLFGFLLAGLSYLLNEHVYPWAHFHKRLMIRESIVYLLKSPPPGPHSFKLGGRYKLSYVHFENGRMERPVLVEELGEGAWRESTAAWGCFLIDENDAPVVRLVNGESTEYSGRDQRRVSGEGDVLIRLDSHDFFTRPKNPPDMASDELLRCARIDPGRTSWALTEYYGRLGRSLAPVLLTVICMSVGIFLRRGNRLIGLGGALPAFFLYMVLVMTCGGSGANGKLSPWIAGTLPEIVLAGVAAPLLLRVYRR